MADESIILCSGGLDSTTLAYHLIEKGESLTPIFFDYRQHCAETEWNTAQEVLPKSLIGKLQRIDLTDIYASSASRMIVEPNIWEDPVKDADLYIPYRTMMFLTVAACIAQSRGVTKVYSAYINSNHAKELDCSAKFLNDLDALAENVGPVRFLMPFRDWSKADVVSEGVRLGVPIGVTFSCQLLSDVPCGACPNCVERLNAIQAVRALS